MKAKFALILTLLLATFMQSCTEDEPQQQSEKVEFKFTLSSITDSGGRTAGGELPEGAELILSLVDNSGDPVLTNHRIEILHMGGSHITGPIELPPGQYTISDFMIAESSEILFAAPKKNSPLAPAVIRPVPYKFSVQKGKITNVEMEVIAIDGYSPEDFGYVSFGISVVNPLPISVFTIKDGVAKFATAEAFIYSGSDLIGKYNLKAKANLISFKGDTDAEYQLVVIKPGFAPYRKHFIYSDLMEELGNLPLKIILTPAFTILTDSLVTWEMTLDGTGGVVNVDWGDGTTDSYDFTVNPLQDMYHTYATEGIYYISLTGAIDQVTEFYNYYDAGGTASDIHFEHLSGLQSVRYGLNYGPAKIDLSQNSQLDFINMAGRADMEELILPDSHEIKFILVSGPNLFSTSMIDSIINNIYTNTVAKNIHDGAFSLREHWYDDEEGDGGLIGPPSAAGLAQLEELRNVYGWSIGD